MIRPTHAHQRTTRGRRANATTGALTGPPTRPVITNATSNAPAAAATLHLRHQHRPILATATSPPHTSPPWPQAAPTTLSSTPTRCSTRTGMRALQHSRAKPTWTRSSAKRTLILTLRDWPSLPSWAHSTFRRSCLSLATRLRPPAEGAASTCEQCGRNRTTSTSKRCREMACLSFQPPPPPPAALRYGVTRPSKNSRAHRTTARTGLPPHLSSSSQDNTPDSNCRVAGAHSGKASMWI